MKRFLLLLLIGAAVLALTFACVSDPKEKKQPEEGDSTAQETLKGNGESSGDSVAQDSVFKSVTATGQETLQVSPEEEEKLR